MRNPKSLLRLLGCLVALSAAQVSLAAPNDCGKLKGAKFPNTRITVVEEVSPNPIWIYPPCCLRPWRRGSPRVRSVCSGRSAG